MEWNKLSIAERAKYIKTAVKKGVTDLNTIKNSYREYDNGGNLYSAGNVVNAIYDASTGEKYLGPPKHNYDFAQAVAWAEAHGYFEDERGHRDDRVKKPAHPTHPSRGTWNEDEFKLTDLGLENPNHTLFGMYDGGQDPQAYLTHNGSYVLPEITVTPEGNYIHNTYDNILLELGDRKAEGGYLGDAQHPITLRELVVTPQSSALARSRQASGPNINFDTAQDLSGIDKFRANNLAGVPLIGVDPHTCLNTVTGFCNPSSTVASNVQMVSDPERYGYIQIDQSRAIPGDIIILSNGDNHPTHAVMFDKVAEQNGTHRGYPVAIGDTLVNYSNGGRGKRDYRFQGPLPRFDDPENAGGDFSGVKRYYRYVGKKKAQQSKKNKK